MTLSSDTAAVSLLKALLFKVATSLCFPSLFYWKDVVFIVMYLR